ncbi:MAG: ECF-type sigma factor [Phycisphaerales bacterium]
MSERSPNDLTLLLAEIANGNEGAARQLFPLVYAELRGLAGSFFRRQDASHTLQPTALVHEAYVKMTGCAKDVYRDRAHFFAVAATAMRQILTDHVRRQRAAKRGGERRGGNRIELSADVAITADRTIDLIAIGDALDKLAALDGRKCRVVELKFFGGLTNEEVAEALDVSRATVADDWTVARAFLRGELSGGESP